jgi:energy-coupling factor transport system substrate-specific component
VGRSVAVEHLSTSRKIGRVALAGALTGAAFLLSAGIPLVPGAIHLRIFAFLPCVIGILYGPVTGFFAGAIGNTLWAILGGYFNLATPITDLLGVGLTGLIPGLLVKPRDCLSTGGLAKAAIVSLISGIIMCPIVALGMDVVGAAPFMVILTFLLWADNIPIFFGTPLLIKYLLPSEDALHKFLRRY